MHRHAKGPDQFSSLTIMLHWLIALLILALIVLGFVMTRSFIDPALQFSLFQWHKSFGMLALLVSLIRFAHSLFGAHPTPVFGMSALERLAARAMHYLLLLLALAVPIAGWMIASVSTLEIPTFAFDLFVIPHLPVAKSDAGEAWWTTAHTVLSYLVLALVALHASAALYHHYIRRDAVLIRMLGIRSHRRNNGQSGR